jgi:DNA replication and repair protein RecF
LYVRALTLENFRNYRELSLGAGPGRLVFAGENAQGKSNLLEAAYLLVTGHSARASHDAEMIGWGAEALPQPYARVTAEVVRKAGPVRLEAVVLGPPPALGSQGGRAGKRFRVNGIARRSVDLVGQLRAVLFTANDMEIVTTEPITRPCSVTAVSSSSATPFCGGLRKASTRSRSCRSGTNRSPAKARR